MNTEYRTRNIEVRSAVSCSFLHPSIFLVRYSIFALVLIAVGLPAVAEETAPKKAEGGRGKGESEAAVPASSRLPLSPLRFRRVYAPAGRMTDWPRGKAKLLPIDSEEFERKLAVVSAATRGERTSMSASVTASRYQARLDGDRLVDGKAVLEVIHSKEDPTRLALDPCRLAIGRASWVGAEEEQASLGISADGKLGVLVKRSGRLQLGWSLRGRRDAAGTVSFQLDLAPCPTIRLVLDLPQNMIPAVDYGVVRQPVASGVLRRWQIELGGRHRVALRIVPAESAAEHRHLTLLRQKVQYQLSPHGVEVSTELRLDVHGDPLRQVVLSMDPQLQLATARYGDLPVDWSVTSDPDGGATRLVLDLPEAIQGAGRVLYLEALAPLKTDQRWRLPAIRPQGMFWQQGSATLLVPAPLLVQQLVPVRSRQSKTTPLSAPREGESIELQYFAPDATVDVVLSRRRAPLEMRCGTAVELGGSEMTGRVVADFSVAEGERFQLEAEVARHWIIDSVESDPPEAMDDWNVEEKAEGGRRKVEGGRRTDSLKANPFPLPPSPFRVLTIRLAKAICPSRPVRMTIAGRRLHSPLGRAIGMENLVLLRFHAPPGGRRLVAISAVEPYQLKLEGAGVTSQGAGAGRYTPGALLPMPYSALDPRSLDDAELALFAEPPRDLLLEHDARAALLRVSLEARKPSYSVTIGVEATVVGGELIESYRLACVPESARVDRVLVHFFRRRRAPPRWTLGADDEGQLTARRLSAAEQTAARLSTEGETWEITLRRPRSVKFEIRTTRTEKLTQRQPINLVSAPEATPQLATLVVRSSGCSAARIDNRRLLPIPAETIPDEQYTTARATYRYDPLSHVLSDPAAAITIAPGEKGAAGPGGWIWSCQLESRYEADGAGRHLATYRLQVAGRQRLELTLPAAVSLDEVKGVWVDDTQVACRRIDEEGKHRLAIDLPPAEKFPTVSVHFTTTARRLGIVTSIDSPLPEADIPVLARHWTVWLPPGYSTPQANNRWQPPRWPRLTFSQRLFGPLGRAAAEPPFDPVKAEDWSRWFGYRPDRMAAEQKARQLLQQLGRRADGGGVEGESDKMDWGTLLSQAVSASKAPSGQRRLPLLVDRHALARVGLVPRTPVAAALAKTVDAPTDRGVALLHQANLALLVHADGLVLTSATAAALDHDYLAPLEHQTVWWILPGPLADQVKEGARGWGLGARGEALKVKGRWPISLAPNPESLVPTPGSLIPADAWRRRPAEPKMPWTVCRQSGCQATDALGWSARRLEMTDAGPAHLTVVHDNSMHGFRWITFLAIVALLWWKASDRPILMTAAAGVLGVAALLVPETCLPVASGALLGILFCLGCRLICRRREPAGEMMNDEDE